MGVLQRFDTPARLVEPTDADRGAWSARVAGILGRFVGDFPQLYDPTVTDTPAQAQVAEIAWSAFPARLLRGATSEEGRWRRADEDRAEQDEYCEWSVERDANGAITRVTFTSEVPEYWEHVGERDPERLLALYHQLVSPEVTLDDLLVDGVYKRDNRWNASTRGRLAHLAQESNTLEAAVALVAVATVPRERDGVPVTEKQGLARCAGLGNPFRNSDPQIAVAVNSAARSGAEVTLLDPVGLYIDGITTAGMTAPDGADPASFWTVERGDAEHALRARYEVPAGRGYAVGDITLGGRPIESGAQLADRVQVRIAAVVKPAAHTPAARPCEP